jgi:hypothetical protein
VSGFSFDASGEGLLHDPLFSLSQNQMKTLQARFFI